MRRSAHIAIVAIAGCIPDIRVIPGDAGRMDASDAEVPTLDVASLDASASDAVIGDGDAGVDAAGPDVCGACALAHASSGCVDGGCAVRLCAAGFADCNGVAADGCEADLATPGHCGTCASDCGTGLCSAGRCVGQRSCPVAGERGCGMAPMAGGTFMMGSAEASTAGIVVAPVRVSPFLMDTHEVTLARFRRFWEAGHPASPSTVTYPGGTLSVAGDVVAPTSTISGVFCDWSERAADREAHPLNCVTWPTAMAFCMWDGGRLPTEAEFEYTARVAPVTGASTPHRFPWGDSDPLFLPTTYPRSQPCTVAQINDCLGDDGARTRRVGSFAEYAGVFDLAGNVSEWLADNAVSYQYSLCWMGPAEHRDPICTEASSLRSVRGGDFRTSSVEPALGAFREGRTQLDAEDGLGFRCVRSP